MVWPHTKLDLESRLAEALSSDAPEGQKTASDDKTASDKPKAEDAEENKGNAQETPQRIHVQPYTWTEIVDGEEINYIRYPKS